MNSKSTKELEQLKQLVSDSLVKDGTLGKIKAELRASVFSVINANKNSEIQLKNHDENIKKINSIKNLDGGIKMLELICDFLNFYGMTYTKSVLLAEASLMDNSNNIDLIDKISSATNNILNNRKSEIIIDDNEEKSDEAISDYMVTDTDLQTSDCSLTSENLSRYDYYEEPEFREN
ncbi:hypothetical protein BCR36DRAFT_396403 [Piromyces finnis]|uniref:FGFR1 oncogene partner (FOP) N-terminal dimerisation domain-containing protein n=1 Tax=Piromyces finnis TaxID=1754191 RepID=A0A1Y1VGM0_9FUNG|nr:hypothetical protein BCR36DRAFT_396403 [Piromyces finnis]|eukprot:ORX54331.1 hypothetical protein BCR36DRAFT_396403 [Piromyces finnis]